MSFYGMTEKVLVEGEWLNATAIGALELLRPMFTLEMIQQSYDGTMASAPKSSTIYAQEYFFWALCQSLNKKWIIISRYRKDLEGQLVPCVTLCCLSAQFCRRRSRCQPGLNPHSRDCLFPDCRISAPNPDQRNGTFYWVCSDFTSSTQPF